MIENFKEFKLNFGDQKLVVNFFGSDQFFWGSDHKVWSLD
jgi:hypothetical protein